jgi:transposase-like protein
MRKTHTSKEKARLVLEVLQGERTLQEIASVNNIHPVLLTRWKTQAISGMPDLFEKSTAKTRRASFEAEREKDDLYRQIGKLTTQIEWLKKKSGHD